MADTEKLIDKNAQLEKEVARLRNGANPLDIILLNNKYLWILVAIMAIMSYSLVGMLAFVEVPEANQDIVRIGIGIVFGAFNIAIGYIFGRREEIKAPKA